MIDSHCHLDRLDLTAHQGSLPAALDAARANGVKGFMCIGIGFQHADSLIELQNQHEDVWLSLGVHPLDDDLSIDEQLLRHWCGKPEVIALGETGLDYHYQPQNREAQITSFVQHLQVAAELNKPLVVHTRAAQDDTLRLIKQHGGESAGILHCFTESWDMATQALDMNYMLSISGIVTFANADNVRQVAKKIPLDRLLIETDSPYLAPTPYRGKPNEPAYLPKVVDCLAELRNISTEQLIEATTENFHRLFPSTRTGQQKIAV